MRHRYIFCGVVNASDRICEFRLIRSCTRYCMGGFIRVSIPDDLHIDHYRGDSYDTTIDHRTLAELGYDCYILYEGKWVKANFLKEYQPYEWSEILRKQYNIHRAKDGYWSQEQYKYHMFDFRSEESIRYPRFKECKHDLLTIISNSK